ncbi:MAG TPA: hypothetical protein VJN62_01270 [Gemmatimonadales bacterium]|nr:hypothetical protein [Gemmatimonadales bacterium]
MAALVCWACEADIPAGPDSQVPVVQALLVLGDSTQTAWVEWRLPADSTATSDVRPVPPALVQLWLIRPAGDSVPLGPVAGTPGKFDAISAVTAGGTYLLHGTVAGRPVAGITVVPGPLDIRAPVGDTVSIGAACYVFCPFPYRWFAAGTDAYWLTQTAVGPPRLLPPYAPAVTSDTAGVLQLLRVADTMKVFIYALDAHAAAFFLPANPKSSITGLFGFFGSASRVERWVIFQ